MEQAALRKNGARRGRNVIVTCAAGEARFVGWKSNLRTLHVFLIPSCGRKRVKRDSRGHRRILIVYRLI